MKQVVYLSGGLNSKWQDVVIKSSNKFVFIDPRKKELGINKNMSVSEYASWDLHYIDKCDLVFVFVEKTNPSCIGLSAEIGYAKGTGKTIILVLEKDNEHIRDSYLLFLTKLADVVFNNLPDGIKYLKTFIA